MTGYGNPGQAPPPRAKKDLPLFDLIGVGLGGLSFIWGFLHFYSGGSQDVNGYESFANGIGPIGLSILASSLAGAVIVSAKVDPVRPPYALAAAVAALLTTFGALVGKGDASVSIGLILLLITTVGQVAVFGYSWLLAAGKIAAPKPNAPQQWGGAQYGQQPGYGPSPGGYGQPGPPPGYGPPGSPSGPSSYGPPGSPSGSSGYAPPSGYGEVPQPPSGYSPGGGYAQPPPSASPAPPTSTPPAPPSGPQPGGGYAPPNPGGYGQG